MLKRVGIVVLWVAVTVATGSITLAAVGGAGGGIGDRPAVPVPAADLAVPADPAASTSSAAQSTLSTEAVASTTVPTAGTTSVTSSTDGSATTAATIGGSSSSSGAESQVTVGGTVIVARVGSGIVLSSAFPAQGFDMAVDVVGTDLVTVVFEERAGVRRVAVSAALVDGSIEWDLAG